MDSTPDPEIGQPFYVQCMFTGIPAPQVIWRKDKDVINTTDGYYEITTVPGSSSRLKISKSNNEFNGLYECIVTNIANSVNRSFDIELKGEYYQGLYIILQMDQKCARHPITKHKFCFCNHHYG